MPGDMATPPTPVNLNELAVVQPLAINEILERTKIVAQVMEKVMKVDTHYGIIPGCKKPSLYKAGAEKIAVTFQLAIDIEIEDLSHGDEIRYRMKAMAKSANGQFLGSAYGECSSFEEKYRWRKANKTEFEDTDDDNKRIKEYSSWKTPQVHTNPADVANTVLQMADKRAYVAVVRKVTAASDVFTQDVEHLESGMIPEEDTDDLQPTATEEPPPKSDKPKTGEKKSTAKAEEPPKDDNPTSTKPVSASAAKLLQANLDRAKVSAEELCKHFKINAMTDLTMDKINDAFVWIKGKNADT